MVDRTLLTAILLEEMSDNELMDQIQMNTAIATHTINAVTGAALLLAIDQGPVRVEGYADKVVKFFSDVEFKSHFRMQRCTFEKLCRAVAPVIVRERSVTLETRMLATLWMLCNHESYRSVAERFGISKGTLHLTIMHTCKALSSLKGDYIKFPESRNEMQLIVDGFHERCGMPGVVGVIDGTHIPIPVPLSEHRASYINSKGFASMQLQVVCDSRLCFLDTYTGCQGSVHDAIVYGISPVYDKIKDLPSEFHVLGDSAYPLSQALLVPYRDNGHLNTVQTKFNKLHSSTRVYVERAIGLLKCKFQRLKSLDMILKDRIPEVITACCVLHNFIILSDMEDEDIEIEVQTDISSAEEVGNEPVDVLGEEKRCNIANML